MKWTILALFLTIAATASCSSGIAGPISDDGFSASARWGYWPPTLAIAYVVSPSPRSSRSTP